MLNCKHELNVNVKDTQRSFICVINIIKIKYSINVLISNLICKYFRMKLGNDYLNYTKTLLYFRTQYFLIILNMIQRDCLIRIEKHRRVTENMDKQQSIRNRIYFVESTLEDDIMRQ